MTKFDGASPDHHHLKAEIDRLLSICDTLGVGVVGCYLQMAADTLETEMSTAFVAPAPVKQPYYSN
ncbi:hypothetical protein [Sphingomonas alpina]|uniref:Uncharacterized protein n=1 Tax=Sphingomonas alpina TaxID=653931 RepID=A0A7H0LP84_9SPHN|nr:hypothetical protein [Sphingomonas alpina]QNQ11487.1 hypothetical protein H3Z74_10320 [Sphingomonas alpina]